MERKREQGGGEGARTGDGVCAGGGEGEETRAESLTAPVVLRMPIRAEEGLSIKIFDMCLILDAQGKRNDTSIFN